MTHLAKICHITKWLCFAWVAIALHSEANGASSSEATVKVTITYAQDQTDFPVKYIAAYNADTLAAPYLSGATTDDIIVPKGKYDFMVVFEMHNNDWYFYKQGNAIVIKENVEVSSDLTINFDALDATNTIKMVAKMPNGDVCKVPTYKYDENFNKIEVEPGNIAETLVFQTVVHRGYGRIYNLSTNGGGSNFIPDENSKIIHNSDDFLAFRVNEVSDKYLFQQLRFMPTLVPEVHSYLVTLRQVGSQSGTVTNQPDTYFNITEEFQASANASVAPRFPYSVSFGMSEGDEYPFVAGFSWANKNVFDLMCCPAEKTEGFESIGCQLEMRTVETNANDGLEYSLTTSPLRIIDAENVKYYPINPCEAFCKDAAGHSMVGPGAEQFVFTPWQKLQPTGSGVPVAVFSYLEMASPYSPDAICPVMNVEYVGRYGEKRNMDRSLMTKTVKFNGEVALANDGGSLAEFGYSWNGGEGLFEIETSCSNVLVGELTGTNTMSVRFDQTKEDKYPPVLQMVQLRDKDGNVTDRFETPDMATLYIAGGDFSAKESETLGAYGEVLYYYELGDEPAVTVEWAKTGSDEYHAFDLHAPVAEYTPGFGHIWEIPLSPVTETGWIDLRVTMEDAAGNRQEQTLSPAFFTKDKSGIEDIGLSAEGVQRVGDTLVFDSGSVVEVFSADGRKELTVQGNSVSLSQLSRGLHIVRCGNITIKVTL